MQVAAADHEPGMLLKTITMTDVRATKLADLANGFANNNRGQAWMQLEQTAIYDPSERAYPTTTD